MQTHCVISANVRLVASELLTKQFLGEDLFFQFCQLEEMKKTDHNNNDSTENILLMFSRRKNLFSERLSTGYIVTPAGGDNSHLNDSHKQFI